AKSRDGGLDQPPRVIGVADIARVSSDYGAGRVQLRFRFAQLLGRTPRQHHPAALGGERFGGRPTDAAAGTGNQGYLAAQSEIHSVVIPPGLPRCAGIAFDDSGLHFVLAVHEIVFGDVGPVRNLATCLCRLITTPMPRHGWWCENSRRRYWHTSRRMRF